VLNFAEARGSDIMALLQRQSAAAHCGAHGRRELGAARRSLLLAIIALQAGSGATAAHLEHNALR
jgi:hypothetical protein